MHNFLELRPLSQPNHSVDVRIYRVLEHKRGEQVRQMLILLIRKAHLDVQDVEANYCIVQKCDKPLDLLRDLLEKLLMLSGQYSRRLIHLVKT